LAWGSDIKGPLSIVLRYLHFFEPDAEGSEEDVNEALDEKRRLCERDGDAVWTHETIPGCPAIVYI